MSIFQLLRGWIYILPIILFSLLYNIPKFAEVRPCQVTLRLNHGSISSFL